MTKGPGPILSLLHSSRSVVIFEHLVSNSKGSSVVVGNRNNKQDYYPNKNDAKPFMNCSRDRPPLGKFIKNIQIDTQPRCDIHT